MSEANLNSNAAALIRKRGGVARKIQAGLAGAGLPDVIGVYRGAPLWLEGKQPGKEKTLTKLQAKTLDDAKKAGAIARVFTTTDEVKKLLDAIDKKRDGSAAAKTASKVDAQVRSNAKKGGRSSNGDRTRTKRSKTAR